jgi:hypothetical protein
MITFKMRGLAILGLIAALGPLSVMAQEPSYFNVPFGFSVGTKSLTPGLYSIRESRPHVLQIQSRDGGVNVVVLATASEPCSIRKALAVMSFEQVGDRYFLSKYANTDRGWALPASADERRLLAAVPRQTLQADIVASSRH